jgi:hypothetical protein
MPNKEQASAIIVNIRFIVNEIGLRLRQQSYHLPATSARFWCKKTFFSFITTFSCHLQVQGRGCGHDPE